MMFSVVPVFSLGSFCFLREFRRALSLAFSQDKPKLFFQMLKMKPRFPVKLDFCNVTKELKQQKALNISFVFRKHF